MVAKAPSQWLSGKGPDVKLSAADQQRAGAFMHSRARPLEQALYAFHFEGAGREGVLDALAAFQNADGGFGRGVEPDLAFGGSSVICTVRAMELLAEVAAPPDCPLVRGGIDYLLGAYDPQAQVWEIVPRAVNDGPHAPWWHYEDAGQAAIWGGYLVNPRAEVIGCLYDYAALVPPALLREVTDSLLGHLESCGGLKDRHEIACCLTLVETAAVPTRLRERLVAHLRQPVARAVERDPAKWDGYCFRPAGYMSAVRSPTSPFADMLAADVERSLDHTIQHQQADGSWAPTWSWGEAFPDAWEQANLAWKGILTVRSLRLLASFARLEAF